VAVVAYLNIMLCGSTAAEPVVVVLFKIFVVLLQVSRQQPVVIPHSWGLQTGLVFSNRCKSNQELAANSRSRRGLSGFEGLNKSYLGEIIGW
jgi:hypothetical protein